MNQTADARARRRQRWVNALLLLFLVPLILTATIKLSPLVGAPVRMLFKVAGLGIPLLLVLFVLARLRRN
jgi:hypothetical protein